MPFLAVWCVRLLLGATLVLFGMKLKVANWKVSIAFHFNRIHSIWLITTAVPLIGIAKPIKQKETLPTKLLAQLFLDEYVDFALCVCVCVLRIEVFDTSIFMVSAFSQNKEKVCMTAIASAPSYSLRLRVARERNPTYYGICIEQIIFLPILMEANHP